MNKAAESHVCLKLKRIIESTADRVMVLKDNNFPYNTRLIKLDKTKNINQQILVVGIKCFKKALDDIKDYYNGYNLTLIWDKTPKVIYAFKNYFLQIGFCFYSYDEDRVEIDKEKDTICEN